MQSIKRLYSPVAFIAQHSIPTTSPVLSVEDSLRTVLHLDCTQHIEFCSPGPEDRDLGHATRVSYFALLWHDCCCVNSLLIIFRPSSWQHMTHRSSYILLWSLECPCSMLKVSVIMLTCLTGQRHSKRVSCSICNILHVHLKLTTVCIKSHLHIWFQIHGIGATQMRTAEYTVQEKAPLTQQLKVCFVSVSTSPRTHLDLWIYKRRPTVCTSRGSLLLTPMHCSNELISESSDY